MVKIKTSETPEQVRSLMSLVDNCIDGAWNDALRGSTTMSESSIKARQTLEAEICRLFTPISLNKIEAAIATERGEIFVAFLLGVRWAEEQRGILPAPTPVRGE